MLLRHPNVMTEAERLALPDPCRPLDRPVAPATRNLQQLLGIASDEPLPQPAHIAPSPQFDIHEFIKKQQQRSQTFSASYGFFLPLSWLPKLVQGATKAWWQQMITDHANHTHLSSLHQLEQRLLLMGQMYHTMLCVFLLCQCKARKTLNPQITLQDLANAINDYVQAHATELEFLTHQPSLVIEPIHVEIAIIAIGWQTSKHTAIAQRTTTISSHNPLINR